MADKQASVRISADPRGFIAGMKQVEGAAKQAGAKVEGVLGEAAANAGKALRDSTGKFLKKGAEEGGRGVLSELRDVEAKSKGIFERIGAYAKKAFGGAAKMVGGGLSSFAKGAGIRGGPGVAEGMGQYTASAASAVLGATTKAVGDANRVLEKATRISIGARGAGQEGVDPKALVDEFYAITQQVSGVTADALADAAGKYVGMTGDLKTARQSMKDFALVSQASGASVEDVAATAAAISQQFGIVDPGEIRESLSALLAQGKAGAFELKDAAALFPSLAAAGASFGLDKGAGGVRTLGGLTQIARTGTGSGEMAATNVQAMLTALKTNADKLQAAGTKVYEGTGANKKTRDLPTIIAEMIAKTGGTDLAKKNSGLTEILTATGFKAIAPLVTQYQGMFAGAKGNDQQRQAEAMEQLRQKIMENVNAAGSWAEVQKDAATASGTASAKTTAAWERFTAMAGDKVLPPFLKIADRVTRTGGAFDVLITVVGGVADTLDFVADQFMWLGKTLGNSDDDFDNAQQKFAARDKARSDLKEMQMRPEEIAKLEKTDPEKLAAMRAKAAELQQQADAYDADAQASWKKYSSSEAGKKAIAEGRSALAAEGKPVEVKLPDKEMRVRITNPKEVGGAAPPANPVPGWVPRGG